MKAQPHITLRKIYTMFFFLGIFFIPFNNFEGLSFLGEYKNEAATYFFLIGFVILIIESLLSGKISLPYTDSLAVVLILFILWTSISTFLNIESVRTNVFKQITGFNRYFRQTLSLLISSILFTTLFWNIIRNYTINEVFKLIRKTILFSLIFVSVYGFIEIAIVYYRMTFLMPLFESFELFPFVNTTFMGNKRVSISSVSYEVPALGNYLIITAPWVLSYIITEKKLYKFIPTILILILVFYSDSRTALICVSLQFIIFLLILIHDMRFRKTTFTFLKVSSLGLFLVLLFSSDSVLKLASKRLDRVSFSKNFNADVSNKSRFGLQYASLQVFKENPVVGVGLGQDTYHKLKHIPYWSTVDNYEFELKYFDQQDPSFPSAYNIYTRILSELGIIGFILFGTFIFLCLYYSVIFWKIAPNKYKYAGMILITSFAGLFFNWMQTDFFRQYGVWLCLVLLIKVKNDSKNFARSLPKPA
ncbi:MAG TPA: O-antigen ligase family protein [Moheibacter sp.]|nr:O-antigen ligase family protein [Moheibacter sp.]